MTTQAHIYFEGTVQGVGFRYTTLEYARSMGLKGWVRNLIDGRVEVFAQGPDNKIKLLIKNLCEHFDGYIRDKKITFQDLEEEHKDFCITH